jgi:hypothetical protein
MSPNGEDQATKSALPLDKQHLHISYLEASATAPLGRYTLVAQLMRYHFDAEGESPPLLSSSYSGSFSSTSARVCRVAIVSG